MVKNFSNLILTSVLFFMLVLSVMRMVTYYELVVYTDRLWASLAAFFFAATVITFLSLRWAKRKGGKHFLYTFLGFSGGKPILYAVVLLIYGINNPDQLKLAAFTFLCYYLLFTIFEVWGTMKINKGLE